MTLKQILFDELSRVLTDYEGNGSKEGTTADDLYSMLVKLQNSWEDVITSDTESVKSSGTFKEWLTGTGHFVCEENGYHNTLIRVWKNADFDYLYIHQQYRGIGIERGNEFVYAGIYCKRDGLVYDSRYELKSLFDKSDAIKTRDAEVLHKNLKAAVRNAVETVIGNNRNNLRITALTSEREVERLAQFQRYSAKDQARNIYLISDDEDSGSDLTYRCDYSPDRWTDDSLLAYILDPIGYVKAETDAYIDSKQEAILIEFLEGDMIAAEYKKIIENPLNPVHRIKQIMRAVSASSAKTVRVTIYKNNIDFTFKTEASQFRSDCTSYYSDWNIAAADRREFERLFGRSAHYRPEDILRIEYSRSVLYEAKAVIVGGDADEV